jgi:hypothetical protein
MKQGFNDRRRMNYVSKRNGVPLTKTVTRDMLNEFYLVEGMSLEEIAEQLNCTRPMVQILMKKNGIKRRNRSTARILAIKRGKIKDNRKILKFSNTGRKLKCCSCGSTPQEMVVTSKLFCKDCFFNHG